MASAAPAALVLPIACALAQAAAAGPEAAQPTQPQRVQITGTAAADDGRDATAARLVVSRDELARHGDTSVVDVLRRVPGITVLAGQGRAADIRMNGLGNGYTQVLINGEAMPGGFSLESLSPTQVERIEVARVATVDLGAQAIAGTINIILRQTARKARQEVKATAGSRAGRAALQLDSQFTDRLEALSYTLGASLARRHEAWPSTTQQTGSDNSGTPSLQRSTQRRAYGLADTISLTPSLTPILGDQDKLSVDAVLRHNRFRDHSDDQRFTQLGPAAAYAVDTQRLALITTLAQGRVHWTHMLAGGASVETRLGANGLRRASDTAFAGDDTPGRTAMHERVTSATREHGVTAAGKLRLPYTDGHAVALGWDGERTTRGETRSQRQSSPIGRPVLDLDEQYDTTVQRLALYLQDEWDLDDQLSAYAGVRWASLRTTTEGAGLAAVGSRSSVASPVLQLLWKPPGRPGDQLRLALSRSYKAPRAADLVPRRFVAIDNTPTTPNLQGNPSLRPELAWGLDVSVEHAWPGNAGLLGLSASARRIQDVVLDQLSLDHGAWVATKANQGSARVFSLALTGRTNLRAARPGAADMDLRASLSRHWSAVDQVPGPDNRLDSQEPWSANLGVDWRAAGLPLTLGASLAHRAAVRARTALQTRTAANAASTLDLYLLWKLGPQAQLRLAVANALAPPERSTDRYGDADGRFVQTSDAPAAPTLRLALELSL